MNKNDRKTMSRTATKLDKETFLHLLGVNRPSKNEIEFTDVINSSMSGLFQQYISNSNNITLRKLVSLLWMHLDISHEECRYIQNATSLIVRTKKLLCTSIKLNLNKALLNSSIEAVGKGFCEKELLLLYQAVLNKLEESDETPTGFKFSNFWKWQLDKAPNGIESYVKLCIIVDLYLIEIQKIQAIRHHVDEDFILRDLFLPDIYSRQQILQLVETHEYAVLNYLNQIVAKENAIKVTVSKKKTLSHEEQHLLQWAIFGSEDKLNRIKKTFNSENDAIVFEGIDSLWKLCLQEKKRNYDVLQRTLLISFYYRFISDKGKSILQTSNLKEKVLSKKIVEKLGFNMTARWNRTVEKQWVDQDNVNKQSKDSTLYYFLLRYFSSIKKETLRLANSIDNQLKEYSSVINPIHYNIDAQGIRILKAVDSVIGNTDRGSHIEGAHIVVIDELINLINFYQQYGINLQPIRDKAIPDYVLYELIGKYYSDSLTRYFLYDLHYELFSPLVSAGIEVRLEIIGKQMQRLIRSLKEKILCILNANNKYRWSCLTRENRYKNSSF